MGWIVGAPSALVAIILLLPNAAGAPISTFGLGSVTNLPSGSSYNSYVSNAAYACAPGTTSCTINGCSNTYTLGFTIVPGTPNSARGNWDFCVSAHGFLHLETGRAQLQSAGASASWAWTNGTGTFTLQTYGAFVAPANAVTLSGSCPGSSDSNGRVYLLWTETLWTSAGSPISSVSGTLWDSGTLWCNTLITPKVLGPWSGASPAFTTTTGAVGAPMNVYLSSGSSYYATLQVGCNATASSSLGGLAYASCDFNPYPVGYVAMTLVTIS